MGVLTEFLASFEAFQAFGDQNSCHSVPPPYNSSLTGSLEIPSAIPALSTTARIHTYPDKIAARLQL